MRMRRSLLATTGPCLSMLLCCWGREVAALCVHVSTQQVRSTWAVHVLFKASTLLLHGLHMGCKKVCGLCIGCTWAVGVLYMAVRQSATLQLLDWLTRSAHSQLQVLG